MVASNLPRRFRDVFSRVSSSNSPVFENATDEEEHILWCCRAAMLEQFQSRQLVKPLIKGLTYRDWFVRYRAASALGRLGDPKALGGASVVLFFRHGHEVPEMAQFHADTLQVSAR